MVVRIYFEGGKHLKEGFHSFFEEIQQLLREQSGKLQPIACQDRARAVRNFMIAMREYPSEHVILLIDCEGPAGDCSLPKLRQMFQTVWKPPAGVLVDNDRVFRMTQIMESWFLADRDCLRKYYGAGFREGSLPGHSRIEDAPKRDVLEGLRNATQNTPKGAYKKGSHANEILRTIDPARVRAASIECARMFALLEAAIAGS